MSAVGELKTVISFKETQSVGIEALIKANIKKAEVAKARKELEKKFENIKANISSTSIVKSVNNITNSAKKKVIAITIAAAINKKTFDMNRQDFMSKAILKAEKPIEKIKQKLKPLKKISYKVIAAKDMMGDGLKTLTAKPYKIMASVALIGKSTFMASVASIGKSAFSKVSGGFSNVKGFVSSAAGGLKTVGGAMLGFAKAAFAGLGGTVAGGISQVVENAVSGGAELEKQNLYMDQAITASNSNMGTAEVKNQRDNYMKQLRDSAAGAGMDSSDVIAAGTKAVGIAGGDTKEAMELVKVAQDMAAMNPGKSVAEAMEALAAAKEGETDALKDFNVDVSQEDFNKLGGFKGVVQQRLKPKFDGGAEALSDTGIGLMSVIKGKLNNKMQDMGLGIIEKLKPALESVIELIDRYSPVLDAIGEGIASGIGLAIDCVYNIAGLIGEKFSWIGEKSNFLKDVFVTSWEGIKSGMATAWEFIQPAMELIANGAMLLFNIFQWAFPGIQAVIENVWSFVQPIFEGLGSAIGWVADKVGKVAEWFGKESSNGDRGSSVSALWNEKEESLAESQPAISTSSVDALRMTAMMDASRSKRTTAMENEYDGVNNRTKTYTVPQTNLQGSKPNVQNQAFTININGVNKSTNEIMNEMMPRLRMILTNM